MAAARRPDRAGLFAVLLTVALVLAIAFMGWSLWSRSRTAVETAVVALNEAPRAPDLPLPDLPGKLPR